MNEETEGKDLHVAPAGEKWTIETPDGMPVGTDETKEKAIASAQKAGPDQGAVEVVVHSADGRVEERLPAEVPPGEASGG